MTTSAPLGERRTAVGGFEPPQTPLQCSGEGTFFVPEKLGGNQRLRDRGAVNPHEGPGSALGPLMQRTRHQLPAFFAKNS